MRSRNKQIVSGARRAVIAVGLSWLVASPTVAWHPQDAQEESPVNPADDHDQVLREAFELLDDGDAPAALRALQRVAVRAPAPTLARLNEWTRTVRGQPLDELLAQTRMRVALAASGGKTFDLRFATPFEAAALGRRLERFSDDCLNAKFSGRTVAAWTRDPATYRELRADTAELESKVRTAAAVITARLSHDPRLKPERSRATAQSKTGEKAAPTATSAPAPTTRGDLIRLRDDLARFSSQLRALPGFTSLTTRRDESDDPTLREAERLEAEREAREREEAEREREDRAEADSQPSSRPTTAPASRPASRPAPASQPVRP